MPIHCPARYVALIVEYLESEGFDCTEALDRTGISRQSFAHLDSVLPLETLAHVSHLLATMSGRPDVFLATGLRCGPAQYGELGRAMLSCATLRDSIEITVRYFPLISRITGMSFKETKETAEVCWQPMLGVPYDMLIASFDFVLGAFYNRLTLILGDKLPDFEVSFSTAQPSDVSRYRRLKPGRVYFGQGGLPAVRFKFGADVLDTRMPLANPIMLRQAEERVGVYYKLLRQPQRDWSAWVDTMLRESIAQQPTLEELAVIANVSASTLNRYLAAQGCNFRRLACEIRHERACHMLREHGMRVGDVAQTLGYTSVGNFIRAFRAEAGMTPTQFAAAPGEANTG